jgi:hypothetical protein
MTGATTRPVNGARGEVALAIGGRQRVLCLTLGALARLETSLQVRGLEALGSRLRALSATDIATVLACLVSDDGPALDAGAIMGSDLSPAEAARAVAACFEAAA